MWLGRCDGVLTPRIRSSFGTPPSSALGDQLGGVFCWLRRNCRWCSGERWRLALGRAWLRSLTSEADSTSSSPVAGAAPRPLCDDGRRPRGDRSSAAERPAVTGKATGSIPVDHPNLAGPTSAWRNGRRGRTRKCGVFGTREPGSPPRAPFSSGCSSAWPERPAWNREARGSSPRTPTIDPTRKGGVPWHAVTTTSPTR
jgi:hypothetical protein